MWQPRWEGSLGENGYMFMYGRIPLLFTWNYHNVINWLFSSVQSLSRVWLFATPWTAACQASLSITSSQSLLRLMSIESVMPSHHLILSSLSPPAQNRTGKALGVWIPLNPGHQNSCRHAGHRASNGLLNPYPPSTESPIGFSSVQSLSRVQLFSTPWTAACQASLSITNSWNLRKLMSIESMMPSNHLILSSPSSLVHNLFQHQGLFQQVSSLHHVAKVLELQLQHQSFQWIFRVDVL